VFIEKQKLRVAVGILGRNWGGSRFSSGRKSIAHLAFLLRWELSVRKRYYQYEEALEKQDFG
jgi:hypothetical protein